MNTPALAVLAACLLASTPALGYVASGVPHHSRRMLSAQSAASAQAALLARRIIVTSPQARAQHSLSQSLLDTLSKPASRGGGPACLGGAFVSAARQSPKAAAAAYTNTALEALHDNVQDAFVQSTKHGFLQAKQQDSVPAFVDTLTTAITAADDANRPRVKDTVARAMADATATADGETAVASATATAICKGGDTATVFSDAMSTAITISSNAACPTVSLAIATAAAACGPSLALSNAKTFATTFNACNVDTNALVADMVKSLVPASGSGGATS